MANTTYAIRVHFFVEHDPIAQPRPRFWKGHAVSVPKGSKIGAFKKAAKEAAVKAFAGLSPLHGPVRLHATFIMPRPKKIKGIDSSRMKFGDNIFHCIRPDVDNLLKGLKDSMTGVCWQDDKQVCSVHSLKLYAAAREKPGVLVQVQELRL